VETGQGVLGHAAAHRQILGGRQPALERVVHRLAQVAQGVGEAQLLAGRVGCPEPPGRESTAPRASSFMPGIRGPATSSRRTESMAGLLVGGIEIDLYINA